MRTGNQGISLDVRFLSPVEIQEPQKVLGTSSNRNTCHRVYNAHVAPRLPQLLPIVLSYLARLRLLLLNTQQKRESNHGYRKVLTTALATNRRTQCIAVATTNQDQRIGLLLVVKRSHRLGLNFLNHCHRLLS